MSWKKYFRVADASPLTAAGPRSNSDLKYTHYASHLPEVYVGHPNRVERYGQYENMDVDSEINSALDILSEFCTQSNVENGTAFDIYWHENPTDREIETLKKQLINWNNVNKFDQRVFKVFRNILKYGDQVFVRDPETFEWFWIDMSKVTKVIVNESEGKEIEQYIIRDLNPNFENLTVTQATYTDDFHRHGSHKQQGFLQPSNIYTSATSGAGGRFDRAINEQAIEAQHIVHCSLTEGLDANWPFGNSVLENVFKVYKQKELLEDAIIIYRIQRAPERRVFYVDVGNMPAHMAMAFVERVKNEIHQRRIPSQTGGGSSIMDTTYNPLCIELSTKIPLLDGRILELNEIINEHNKGKENWVYSSDPVTGKIVPGKVAWAGKTKKNAKVLKLYLDNGKTLTCTPDHKIPVLGKGFVEAKDLTLDDSLISYEKDYTTIDNKIKGHKYEKIFDHELNKWIFTHKMVADNCNLGTFIHEDKYKNYTHVVHHKDFNRANNNPNNLVYMNKGDHIKYHASMSVWNTHPNTELIKKKISKTVTEIWANKSEEERNQWAKDCSIRNKNSWETRKKDTKTYNKYLKDQSIQSKQRIKDNPKFKNQLLKNLENRVFFNNQEFVWTQEMVSRLVTIVTDNNSNRLETIKLANNDYKLMLLLREVNKPLDKKGVLYKINTKKFTDSKLKCLYKQYNFKNWKDFESKVPVYNHKIVKIEYLSERMDTGCLNVDNNYHTFAIESGIFIKNSINEDYFFPQTSEGRGSKVETLPGGTNLGEIDDLRFFTNKLFRGLRIPSTYLPTGPDESPAAYADGRVGTAMIQEHRFNEYCKRLQRLISNQFDKEFKMFLKWRGFELDNSSFELRFNEPQNFTKYRETELDGTRIGTFTQLEAFPYLSKRFLMQRFLGLSEEEMEENTSLWLEENEEDVEAQIPSMRSVGISPGGFESDIGAFEPPTEMGEEGFEGEMPPGEEGTESPIPGTPAGLAPPSPPGEAPPE